MLTLEVICATCYQAITGAKITTKADDNPGERPCDACGKSTIKTREGTIPRPLHAAAHCFPKPGRARASLLERVETHLTFGAHNGHIKLHPKDRGNTWQLCRDITVAHHGQHYPVAKKLDLPITFIGD